MVADFTKSPIETGQSIRFSVSSTKNQKSQIAATRSIYSQQVEEVLSVGDTESIGKLQSEGISVVALKMCTKMRCGSWGAVCGYVLCVWWTRL